MPKLFQKKGANHAKDQARHEEAKTRCKDKQKISRAV